MTLADSLLTFIGKTEKMIGELGQLENRTVNIAALTIKTSVLAEMATAGAGSGRLRGVGKKGARIGVTYNAIGKTALVRATGPFHLLESDTQAHRVPRERGPRARRRVVVIPGVGVRAFANHPGTQGKHPWSKGVLAGIPLARDAQAIALRTALAKAYG